MIGSSFAKIIKNKKAESLNPNQSEISKGEIVEIEQNSINNIENSDSSFFYKIQNFFENHPNLTEFLSLDLVALLGVGLILTSLSISLIKNNNFIPYNTSGENQKLVEDFVTVPYKGTPLKGNMTKAATVLFSATTETYRVVLTDIQTNDEVFYTLYKQIKKKPQLRHKFSEIITGPERLSTKLQIKSMARLLGIDKIKIGAVLVHFPL